MASKEVIQDSDLSENQILHLSSLPTLESFCQAVESGDLEKSILILDALNKPANDLNNYPEPLQVNHFSSFALLLLDVIKTAFQHCKDSESIYEHRFEEVAKLLSTLYQKTFNLQQVLLKFVTKIDVPTDYLSLEGEFFISVLSKLAAICKLSVYLDTGAVYEIWKFVQRVILKHNFLDPLVFQQLFDSISETLSLCLCKLKEIFVNVDFKLSETCKTEVRLLKMTHIYWKVFCDIVAPFADKLSSEDFDSTLKILHSLFTILPFINCNETVQTLLTTLDNHFNANTDLIMLILIGHSQFCDLIMHPAFLDNDSFGNFEILLLILKCLTDNMIDQLKPLWFTSSSHLFLSYIFNNISKVEKELEANSWNLYERAYVIIFKYCMMLIEHTQLVAVETILFDALLRKPLYSHLFAVDIWLAIAKSIGSGYSVDLLSKFLLMLPAKLIEIHDVIGWLKIDSQKSMASNRLRYFLANLYTLAGEAKPVRPIVDDPNSNRPIGEAAGSNRPIGEAAGSNRPMADGIRLNGPMEEGMDLEGTMGRELEECGRIRDALTNLIELNRDGGLVGVQAELRRFIEILQILVQ